MEKQYCRHDLKSCTGECLLVEKALIIARDRFTTERIATFGNPTAMRDTIYQAAADPITGEFAFDAVSAVAGFRSIWTRDHVVALLNETIQAVTEGRP